MELLSPAGDFASLKTAVRCGADAVYIGGKCFSARRNANNFTNEEIAAAVDFCHLHKVKVYVTVNIVIKEDEFSDALSFASFLAETGADGIIVQDLGLLCAIRNLSPDIRLNASTQMTVCSADGVNLLQKLGANRVVLSRELSKEEIASINAKTTLELEAFVHGAMCMSWSGQCYLSSIIGGRSGNRGLCAQPCRLPYTLYRNGQAVTNAKNLLCMKDLCLAKHMHEFQTIADSAKIEGRMKSPEYAGVVTRVYKQAMEGAADNAGIQDMLSFFSRGGSGSGYFHGRGFDKLMDYTGAEKVTASKDLISEIQQTDIAKKRAVSFRLTAREGLPLALAAECDGFSANAAGAPCERAKSAAFDEMRAKEQIGKLGDTAFVVKKITTDTEGQPFVSVSALNSLRRQVCADLQEQICASYRRNVNKITEIGQIAKRETRPPKVCVQVRTKEQMEAAASCGIKAKYLSYDLFRRFGTEKDVCVLPPLTKEGETLHLESAARVMVQNIGQIEAAKEKIMCGGERLNVTNSETMKILSSIGMKRVTLSPEPNLKEMKQITDHCAVPAEVIAYGRLSVMLLENCVIKSAYRCTKGEGFFELCDRKGERFPVLCEGCRNVVLNSVPLYMADKLDDIVSLNAGAIRLVFTTETGDEVKKVLSAYQAGLMGKAPRSVFDKITRGHFYRGVE